MELLTSEIAAGCFLLLRVCSCICCPPFCKEKVKSGQLDYFFAAVSGAEVVLLLLPLCQWAGVWLVTSIDAKSADEEDPLYSCVEHFYYVVQLTKLPDWLP